MLNLTTLILVVSAGTTIGTLIVGFYYVLHYLDRMEQRINHRFTELENRMNQRFDRLEQRMDRFEQRLTELTVEVKVMQGKEANGHLTERSAS